MAGTSYDQIDVTGTVTLTGAKLTLSLGYTPASGDSFILIANDGTDAIVGTMKNSQGETIAEGETVTSGVYTFKVSYLGGTGNDLTLTVMNFAPVLDATPSPTLTDIAEDVTSADNTGTNVSSLVTGAITDQDGTAVAAIAVTAVDNTNGAWQYSTDNGTTWNAFGTVTEATSRLLDGTLTGNDTQKIRFVPTLNYNGSATITFRAWDKSTGTSGNTVNTSTGNGGTTAYSTVTDTASITISAVNDKPALTTPTAISLTDTSATDAFTTNQTGTLSATDVEGTTLSYGITDGTTGGVTVGSTTYDVSKTGTYGTLHLLSTTGAYVYVPNASAINALTANMTESFTLSASDGLLSDSKTLTINLTGVNDIPIMTVAPVVTGTATVGGTLSAGTGTWTDADNNTLTYTYQWYRATDAAGTGVSLITGATSATYSPTTLDAHKFVKVIVTANDGNGSSTVTAQSAYTTITNTDPTNSVAPAITGTATVGNALTASTGTWADTDSDTLTYTYQWYRATDAAGDRCRRDQRRHLSQLYPDHGRRAQVPQGRRHRQRCQRQFDPDRPFHLHHHHQHRSVQQRRSRRSPAPQRSAMSLPPAPVPGATPTATR